MTLDLGDPAFGSDTITITMTSDGTGSAGDVVDISTEKVTQAATGGAANADLSFGVLAEDSPADGEDVSVHVAGVVVVNADTGVTTGEVSMSQTNAGAVEQGTGGWWRVRNEGAGRMPTGGAAVDIRN